VRTWRMSPTLFVLLVVSFGLFLAYTFVLRGPEPGPITDAATVTVLTDVPSRPDAPGLPTLPTLPALAVGGPMLIFAIACGLLTFVSAALATYAAVLAATVTADRCRGGHDQAALLN